MILNKLKAFFNRDITTEGIEDQQELLELSMDKAELVRQIDRDIENSIGSHTVIKQIQDDNEQYYLGEQLDKSKFSWELPSAENLLYMGIETVLSIITAKRREPIVLASQNTDESKELAQKTQQWLSWKWSVEDMIIKFEDWVRHSQLFRIGILKIRWDIDRDDFVIENVRPQRIVIDKNATTEENAKFIVEYKEDILSDLIDMFPAAKADLKEMYGDKMGTNVKYVEYWTNEFVVWKVDKIILGKKKNPNWNWDEKDRKDNMKKLRERWINKAKNEKLENILLNYFDKPQKPYIILSLKNLNKSIYSETSDFEQGKIIQDIINRRKRQIDKAGVRAIGREVYSGSYISKEEAKKSISNPNAPVWLERGKASDAVSHISPQPVSPVLFDDLQESKQALDNVMGIHGTTRGERGATETATGRSILREGDLGRIDLTVRRVDKKTELLYAWMLQMAKVYYTEQHYVKMLGDEGATAYLKFSQNDVEDGQEVIVKSELTVDKATQRENALQRLQSGLSDPISFFEEMDMPNPKEKARMMILYQTDPKLYLQQFCVTADMEGAENDPTMKAEQENRQLMNGEKVPGWQGANKEHLEAHGKLVKSSEFNELDDIELKQNVQEHIQAELDILKGQTEM